MTSSSSSTSTTGPSHVYGIYIRCTPEELWRGITDGALTRQYFHDTVIESSWEPGAPVRFLYADGADADHGAVAVEGKVLECDPPRRLAITWKALYNPEAADEPPSRVTWEIEPMGDSCRLSVVHDQFDGETPTYHGVKEGWLVLLSSLKSLLETGAPIHVEQ